LFLGRALD